MTGCGARWRSALYVPADRPRALEKAALLPADALILDLEDAVAPEMKAAARAAAVAAVMGPLRGRQLLIRVNGADSAEWDEDLAAALEARPAGVVVPKAHDCPALLDAAARLPGVPVWAMIETPAAVIAVHEIAQAAEGGLIAGLNDLALATGITPSADRREYWHALSAIVLAARAAGTCALDGVPLSLSDAALVEAEAAQARAFGFDGKTLVHPDQIAPAHAGFAPSPAEAEAARALLAAWEARRSGAGVIAHAGRMVEALHAEAARRLLARA